MQSKLYILLTLKITRLEFVHSRGYIHRDIKPDNLLVGGELKNIIYLIDYGLSKEYKDNNTGLHIEFCSRKGLIGTAKYASINTHRGFEQSRRDDLESAGYVFIYLLKGELPWDKSKVKSKAIVQDAIYKQKVGISISSLFPAGGSNFTYIIGVLDIYINYCQTLKFQETPDYAYIKSLFSTSLHASQTIRKASIRKDSLPV